MNDDKPRDPAQDQLLRRMRAADPARSIPAADSPMPNLPDLMEATMSTTPAEPTTRNGRWVPALAAAAALAAVAGGAYATLGGHDDPGGSPAATVTTLAMPGGGAGTSTSSCIRFDVEYLRDMPVAFSGTASAVGDSNVELKVDHWYKGGDAAVVRLVNYDPDTVSIDAFRFVQGDRYLITASDGTVNYCGFSGPWNQELADAFQEAFGS